MKKLLPLLLLALLLCAAPAQAQELIRFSVESGFYRAPLKIEITTPIVDAQIYYTTDGSLPDETDIPYTGPITLMHGSTLEAPLMRITGVSSHEDFVPQVDFPTGHVIRAVALSPLGRSEVISGTFMVGYNRNALYGNTSIIFLVTEKENLFDYHAGIYVLGEKYDTWKQYQTTHVEPWFITANFTQRGKAWERPVSVTYLDGRGGGFTQEMGLRIKGGATRTTSQKSFRLIADKDYGAKNLKYILFPGNVREADGGIVDRYKSFSLRSGGNDFDHAVIRDPLINALATGMRLETRGSQPCIAFLNGEFWGVYTLYEEYSSHYIQYHYGMDDNDVITVKRGRIEDGEDADISLYRQMAYHIAYKDMSDPAQYARACEMLDVASFADQCALLLYTINTDGMFTDNNWQMWRVRNVNPSIPQADGRWRMMLFDSEMACGLYDEGRNYNVQNITPVIEGAYGELHPARLLTSLLRNSDFRQLLVTACCDVRNLYMSSGRAKEHLDGLGNAYLPYLVQTLQRYGPSRVQRNPQRHLQDEFRMLGSFFSGRYVSFPGLMRSAFGLGRACNITIQVEERGAVCLNGRSSIPLTGSTRHKYFDDYPITLAALPEEGARFLRWEITQGEATLTPWGEDGVEVRFTGAFTIRAVFE